jgi:argininosuccinate lyase
MGVMAVLKGTPTTYNKDFQECWELMFDSVDALHDCIRIATGVLSTIKINPDRMMKVTHACLSYCQTHCLSSCQTHCLSCCQTD